MFILLMNLSFKIIKQKRTFQFISTKNNAKVQAITALDAAPASGLVIIGLLDSTRTRSSRLSAAGVVMRAVIALREACVYPQSIK